MSEMITPPTLKEGDLIYITAPAKATDSNSVLFTKNFLEQKGFRVLLSEHCLGSHRYFSGTDAERTADMQFGIDHPEVKAILCARGGYGCVRIVDEINWANMLREPKWIIGFSDITILLSHAFGKLNTQSIHAQMPYTFDTSTTEALESLRKILFGEQVEYTYKSEFNNRIGNAEGILIGGNLSLLVAVEGSKSEMDYSDKILFLEDVGEHEYSIDRMIRLLKRAGKLANLKGLIIGAFNEISEEKIPFGQTPEEIIWDLVKEYDYPVCFNFPTGHIDDNRAMVLGKNVHLTVDTNKVDFKYL